MKIKPMLYALAFAAGCSAPLAFADIITFDNADLTGVAVRPTIFTTQGFVFTAIDLELIGGGVEPYSNGTNVLQFGPRDRVSGMDVNAITFRRQDAALFNLTAWSFRRVPTPALTPGWASWACLPMARRRRAF